MSFSDRAELYGLLVFYKVYYKTFYLPWMLTTATENYTRVFWDSVRISLCPLDLGKWQLVAAALPRFFEKYVSHDCVRTSKIMWNSCQIHGGKLPWCRPRKLESYCRMSDLGHYGCFTFHSNYVQSQTVSQAFCDFPSPPSHQSLDP